MTTWREYKDVVAIPVDQNRVLGFHARNLELASLTHETWDQMSQPAIPRDPEVWSELENWQASESPSVHSGKIGFGIRSLTLNVSQICNLHCTYCAAGGDGTYGDPVRSLAIEKTIPQLQWLLAKVPAGEVFTVTFLGGEPLLYPKVIQALCEFATEFAEQHEISVRFAVVTNGTLINRTILQMLTDFKFSVVVSLDGPPEINDRTRPDKTGRGATAKIVENLNALVEVRSKLAALGLSAVFDQNNMEVVKAYEFFSPLAVDYFEFNFSHTEKSSELSELFVSQMQEVARLAYDRGGEEELRRIKLFDNYFRRLDDQQRVENFCGSGRSFLMIDARNNAYSCPWLVGDRKDFLGRGTELDEKQLLESSATQTIEQNGCGSCWARYLCGGGCMFIHNEATGSKHQKSEVFCSRTRNLIALSLMYYFKLRAESDSTLLKAED